MWLWYDWQAAAVVDEHGHLVDVMQWDGHMTEHAVVERLRLIASGQPIREARELHDRFPEAKLCVHGDPNCPMRNGRFLLRNSKPSLMLPLFDWRWKVCKLQQAIPTADWNTSFGEAVNSGPAI